MNSDIQDPRLSHIDMNNPINRLAYTNIAKERENQRIAKHNKKRISEDWKKKMAGNNTLSEKLGGM